MKQLRIGSTDLKVSSFCLGCMPFNGTIWGKDIDDLMDCFRDAGGNFYDTAHCYSFWQACGDGGSERALGAYLKKNACRDASIIATKGGHPGVENYRKVEAYLSAGRVEADIDDSLARLQIEVIDLYWLHRDDPRLDVGAILDILNAEVKRGRIRYFGGSNWTASRLDEANAYAKAHGMDGFVASQPRWSLLQQKAMSEAERLEPGVLLHVNDEDRQRHTRSQLAVIPYSPTGKGFFAMKGKGPERCISGENLVRAQRVLALAAELNVTPGQVALAWLNAQPFPVIPILGTSNLEHLKDALDAADIVLSVADADWLEGGGARG